MIKIDVWKNVLRILDTYLEMNNHRKTPERYTILKAIYNIDGHFTLDDLSAKLDHDYKFRVSRATLYNTLFLELRLVIRHRFHGSTAYEACYDNTSHCHQICTICGRVTDVKSNLIEQAIDATHFKRFRKDGFTLYVYGICSVCQGKMTRMRNKEEKKKLNDNKL